MSSMWGNKVKISIFGESHGEAVGVTIDGLPSGIKLDLPAINEFMQRRASKGSPWTTSRTEDDIPAILSGVYNETTTGTPLCAIIENKNTRSSDYSQQRAIPRPGHADLTAMARYSGFQDPRGGGHFSGRLTAPLVFAGAICSQILKQKKINIFAHIDSIGDINDTRFNPVSPVSDEYFMIAKKDFPIFNDEIKDVMVDRILMAKKDKDSVGGVVECIAYGLPAGIGNPIFASIESRISSMMFSIPAVKGIEFGAGFEVSKRSGSQNNDSPVFVTKPSSNNSSNNSSNKLSNSLLDSLLDSSLDSSPNSSLNSSLNSSPNSSTDSALDSLPNSSTDSALDSSPNSLLDSSLDSSSEKQQPSMIRYVTNNAGGIEGGISNGMPILFRVAFKPTPSISKEQESIDLATGTNVIFEGKGRHDPCIVPRAVAVVEAACAIVMLDMILE